MRKKARVLRTALTALFLVFGLLPISGSGVRAAETVDSGIGPGTSTATVPGPDTGA